MARYMLSPDDYDGHLSGYLPELESPERPRWLFSLDVLGDKASKYWFRKKKWMSALIERIAKATYHQRFDTTPFGFS